MVYCLTTVANVQVSKSNIHSYVCCDCYNSLGGYLSFGPKCLLGALLQGITQIEVVLGGYFERKY